MYTEETASSATIDELYKVTMIDRIRKVKITIQLKDEEGDEIPVRETIEQLTSYISDKVAEDKPNVTKQQVMPLMAQAMVGGMIKLLGPSHAMLMLSNQVTRYGLINMMTVSFYLLKWLQKNKIKIHTIEDSITEEEIDMYDRINTAGDLSIQAAAMGADPKKVIREMIKLGKLKKSDLAQMGTEDWLEKETEEDKKESN